MILNYSKILTFKHYIIDSSISQIMTNSQTSIYKFSDVIDEKIAENENNEREIIQTI